MTVPKKIDKRVFEDPDVANYYIFLNQLHKKWTPHEWQLKVLNAMLVDKKRLVMLNCGRKWGKTNVALYCLWRKANEVPNSIWYYVCPTEEHAKHIVWNTQRLQNYGPAEFLLPGKAGIKESDMSVHFRNGSVIYLKGSTGASTESLRGTEPHGAVYDEFRDFDPAFHAAMEDNYTVHQAQVLIISTPPSLEEIQSGKKRFYQDMIDECSKEADCAYFHRPHTDNPYNKEARLQKEDKMRRQGRIVEVEREMYANILPGSSNDLIPEFGEHDLTPHRDLVALLNRCDPRALTWTISIDPSGMTRWGALFAVLDKKTKRPIILDKITLNSADLDDKQLMTHVTFWPLIVERAAQLNPNLPIEDWTIICDCASPDFINAVRVHFKQDSNIIPVNKKAMKQRDSYVAIRDLAKYKRLVASDRVIELVYEFKAMRINPNTELPHKSYDELIDCLRYIIIEMEHELYDGFKEPKSYNGLSEVEKMFRIHEDDLKEAQKARQDYDNLDYTEYEDDLLW